MKKSTTLSHHPYQPPAGFVGLQPPTYRASTVVFRNMAAVASNTWQNKAAYTYGLHGTPASFVLEERLAALEGGQHCLLLPSGLAALALVDYALLQTGDEVLLPHNAYGPNIALAQHELKRFGIRYQLYNPLDVTDVAAKINAKTRLIWLEAAGSVTMEFPDLLGITRLCQQRGITTALDNTWGAGLAFSPFDLDGQGQGVGMGLGVDISVHALTKFPCGGGDVLMGSVVTRHAALHQRLMDCHMRTGQGVGGDDVALILRGLPSMALRYAQHDATARQLATWLAQQPAVAQVLHPALPSGLGHAHWQALCCTAQHPQGLAAGLFSIVLAPHISRQQALDFCDTLRLFQIGYSWGGHASLVMHYSRTELRSKRQHSAPDGEIVRLYCGLEDADDLQADLALALQSLL
jgi:cystathionine beta-lyase